MRRLSIILMAVLLAAPAARAQSVARQWNEECLAAIRNDRPRPPVHARNLFHLAAVMYDAWAAYDATAQGYLFTEKLAPTGDVEAARAEAISFAAYRIVRHRFRKSPGADFVAKLADDTMADLGRLTWARLVGDRVMPHLRVKSGPRPTP